MSTPLLIRVRLLRALSVEGHLRVAGALVDLPAADVRELLRMRRAVLVDDADLALLLNADSPIDGRRPALRR